jgi:energy-coupling factor transporter ATP-binding protein EcfA2
LDAPVLSLEGVAYRYPGAAPDSLQDVTVDLPGGGLIGVLGASEAGLTSLCLVLAGLAPRVVGGELRGMVRLDGKDIRGWPMHRVCESVVAGVGRPAAQLSLVAATVYEEVAFGPANLGLPRAEVMARVEAALDALALTDLATRDPRHLSGGEQQLVVLAGLLAMRPGHLILDAQLAHLDAEMTDRALAALEAAVGSGAGVLLADHRGDAFAARCHQLIGLADGRLVADGPPGRILAGSATRGPTESPARPPTSAPDIVLEGIHFRYPSGVVALAGVDLVIGGGETIALVGPNGSGKTTLAQHLDGLLRPSRGRVLLDGRDIAVRRVADLARSVALGFQDPERQLFARSVGSEVGFGPQQLGRRNEALERAVDEALRAVGLDDRVDAHPQDLGKSRRKLLALASLLAMDAPVLVLDEPTAGLDHAGVAIVERVVAEQRARGRTVVAISHDEGFVARAFDRVVRMEAGRIVADRRA